MKNKYKTLLTILLFFLSNAMLFAQPGSTDDGGTLESTDTPAAPIDDWISLVLVLGLLLGYYILKTRKEISK